MDDKYRKKIECDYIYEEGQKNFYKYFNENKIKEWVNIYLPFIDDQSKNSIIKCYEQIYNNDSKQL